jgi:EmrB/QacA subfamily drug resistance transporter
MRKWSPLVAVCLGTFMLLVDVTIVNVALPSMALALDTSFTSLQWVIDGYALSLAALLLVAGSLADRYGRRGAYVVGLIVFALASLACGLAPSAGALIAARLVQGVGAEAMFAATTALLQSSYSGRDRGTAFGVWGAVNGASAAAGPLLGGVLTQGISWRAIFLVNLPVAVVAVVLALRVLPETKSASGRVDALGGLTFTLATAAAVFGLISGGEHGWGDTTTVASFAVAAAALAGFLVVERRSAHPLLDLGLFRRPSFVVLMLTAVILSAAAFGPFAYTSLWLQSLLGLGPIRAGLVVLPLSVASFAVSAFLGRLLHGRSPRLPVGIGMLLIGAGSLLMMLVASTSGWVVLLPGLVVSGLGVGLATPVLVSAVLATVPGHRAGMAGGAVTTFRQLGMAVGIAVLGTVFAGRIADVVAGGSVPDPGAVAGALSSGGAAQVLAAAPAPGRAALTALAHRAFASGLDQVFLVCGVSALVCGVLVLAVVRDSRADAEQPAPTPVATVAP